VATLLTGVPQPLSMEEFFEWNAYFQVKQYYLEQERENKD
jgi:hypothetical protein